MQFYVWFVSAWFCDIFWCYNFLKKFWILEANRSLEDVLEDALEDVLEDVLIKKEERKMFLISLWGIDFCDHDGEDRTIGNAINPLKFKFVNPAPFIIVEHKATILILEILRMKFVLDQIILMSIWGPMRPQNNQFGPKIIMQSAIYLGTICNLSAIWRVEF